MLTLIAYAHKASLNSHADELNFGFSHCFIHMMLDNAIIPKFLYWLSYSCFIGLLGILFLHVLVQEWS